MRKTFRGFMVILGFFLSVFVRTAFTDDFFSGSLSIFGGNFFGGVTENIYYEGARVNKLNFGENLAPYVSIRLMESLSPGIFLLTWAW
jgi:hypothetical protein